MTALTEPSNPGPSSISNQARAARKQQCVYAAAEKNASSLHTVRVKTAAPPTSTAICAHANRSIGMLVRSIARHGIAHRAMGETPAQAPVAVPARRPLPHKHQTNAVIPNGLARRQHLCIRAQRLLTHWHTPCAFDKQHDVIDRCVIRHIIPQNEHELLPTHASDLQSSSTSLRVWHVFRGGRLCSSATRRAGGARRWLRFC